MHDYTTPEPPVEVFIRDRDAVAKNVTTNGRTFSLMIFAVALAGYVRGDGAIFALLAVGAAIPVGIAVLVDAMPDGRAKVAASLASYAFAFAVTLILLLNIG